jgi:repressor LexA
MAGLTEKQRRFLDYLEAYQKKYDHAPTQVEMQRHFGFKALGTVQDYLKALEQKGVIARESGRWSGIELFPNRLPLLGKVAAGKPIEARKHGEEIEVPRDMLKGSGPFFALQVVGDSMIDEGIVEDDYVIVRQQEHVDTGDLVVALIDNEAVIKRFHRRAAHIELRSANTRYAPLIIKPPQEMLVNGVVCGLIRYSSR